MAENQAVKIIILYMCMMYWLCWYVNSLWQKYIPMSYPGSMFTAVYTWPCWCFCGKGPEIPVPTWIELDFSCI